MNYIQKIRELIIKHKIISGIAALIIIFIGYKWYSSAHATTGKTQYITGAAVKTTIVSSINATGQVSAQNRIDLKPGGSGQSAVQLTGVYVKQGDQVKANQIIATADEKNNNVALIQARASLTSAQANYDNLVAGLSNVDMQTAQLSVTSAQQNYDNTVRQQQKNVDTAYTNLLGNDLILEPSNPLTTDSLTLSGSYSGTTQGAMVISIYSAQDGNHYSVSGLPGSQGATLINRGMLQPLGNGLYVTFSTSGTISTATNWTINIPNIKSSSYQSKLNSYTDAQTTQTQSVQQAANSLQQAKLSLQSKTTPPTSAQVAQAQSQIAQAQAGLASAEVNYNNNIIRSPFDGQVAQLNNQVGDQVTSSTVVATVITNQKLAVISVNEVDASKIKVGDKANITFDAIDGLSVVGTVAEIDTLGTVSQGVTTYTAKIGFDTQDDRIKPGMSAAVAIITDSKTDVVAVPNSAVKSNANGSYVQTLGSDGSVSQKPVEVGLSDDTDTEITSGLSVGDEIVTQTITPTTSATTTTRTGTGLIPGLGGGGGGTRVFNAGGAGRGN